MIHGPHPEFGGYSISSHRCWLPGAYADERTAKYAFRFCDHILQRLQDTVNLNADVRLRVITYNLLAMRKKRCEKCEGK